MHISITDPTPASPTSFTLTQSYRPSELVFALAVFVPGPLLWAYAADTHWWGVLSTCVFAYLAIGFLPPTSSLAIDTKSGAMRFTRRDSPLAAPHHFEASANDVAHVELRNVWVKEISKKMTGVQLLVVFNEGFGIPTSDTLAHGEKNAARLKWAAGKVADAIKVEVVDETHLDPRKVEEERKKMADEAEKRRVLAEEDEYEEEDDFADVAHVDSDGSGEEDGAQVTTASGAGSSEAAAPHRRRA